jgi:hypothetical protein
MMRSIELSGLLLSARACGNQRVVPDVDTSSHRTSGINQRDVIGVQLAHAQFLIGHWLLLLLLLLPPLLLPAHLCQRPAQPKLLLRCYAFVCTFE